MNTTDATKLYRLREALTEAAAENGAPPVILAGLVKGGEYASAADWAKGLGASGEMLWIAADGRVVCGHYGAALAEARGALPITWYRYPEAP